MLFTTSFLFLPPALVALISVASNTAVTTRPTIMPAGDP